MDLDDRELVTARESGASHTISARDPDAARKVEVIGRAVITP